MSLLLIAVDSKREMKLGNFVCQEMRDVNPNGKQQVRERMLRSLSTGSSGQPLDLSNTGTETYLLKNCRRRMIQNCFDLSASNMQIGSDLMSSRQRKRNTIGGTYRPHTVIKNRKTLPYSQLMPVPTVAHTVKVSH